MKLTGVDILEQMILPALREEASDLRDAEDGSRPDRADLRIAAAFEALALNIEYRIKP